MKSIPSSATTSIRGMTRPPRKAPWHAASVVYQKFPNELSGRDLRHTVALLHQNTREPGSSSGTVCGRGAQALYKSTTIQDTSSGPTNFFDRASGRARACASPGERGKDSSRRPLRPGVETHFVRVLALALVTMMVSAGTSCGNAEQPPETPEADRSLAGEHLPVAVVVYERPDGIYRSQAGVTEAFLLAKDATYPRWSPDGRHVAFLRKNQIMRVRADGTEEEVIATVGEPHAINYHPGGHAILFTDDHVVRKVSLDTGVTTDVRDDLSCFELDISRDGTRLVATTKGAAGMGFKVQAFDLPGDRAWKIGKGCSASLSPDGDLVSNLSANHKQLALRDWMTGDVVHTLDAPPDLQFDNQFWSNHPDWIVSQSEGERQDVYIHRVSDNRYLRVTSSGDVNRPDLFIFEPARTSQGE